MKSHCIRSIRTGLTAAVLVLAAPLTSCDPVPPPNCAEVPLQPAGTAWDGAILTVTYSACSAGTCGRFTNVTVSGLEGASLEHVRKADDGRTLILELRVDLSSSEGGVTMSGRYALVAQVTDDEGLKCLDLAARYEFSISGADVSVKQAAQDAPSGGRGTRIAVVETDGLEVTLEVHSSLRGVREWTLTDGQRAAEEGGRLRWRLPERRGVYLAEVVIRTSAERFERDVVMVEVV